MSLGMEAFVIDQLSRGDATVSEPGGPFGPDQTSDTFSIPILDHGTRSIPKTLRVAVRALADRARAGLLDNAYDPQRRSSRSPASDLLELPDARAADAVPARTIAILLNRAGVAKIEGSS